MPPTMPGSGSRTTGLNLDPRTTVIVILVVSSVLLSPAGSTGILGNVARWILIAIPGLLFLASGLLASALRYLVAFSVLAGIPKLLVLTIPERHLFIDIFATWFGGLSLIIPGVTCCWYLLRTTSASEFVATMQRVHCPEALWIPTSFIFRFSPPSLKNTAIFELRCGCGVSLVCVIQLPCSNTVLSPYWFRSSGSAMNSLCRQ